MIYRAMTFPYRDTHCMLFTLPFSSCRELFTSCNNFLHKKRVIINHLPQKLKTACQHFLSELYIHVHVYEMQDLKRVMYSIIEIFTCTSLKYSQTKFLLKIHIILQEITYFPRICSSLAILRSLINFAFSSLFKTISTISKYCLYSEQRQPNENINITMKKTL